MKSLLLALALIGLVLTGCQSSETTSGNSDSAKLETVKFGMLPYGDHTYAIIGVQKGWFKDVGIDLQYQVIKVDDVVPFVSSGSVDVSSGGPGLSFAAYENSPGVVFFVAGDIFQGYGIMGQKSYKSYDEFIAEGMSKNEAIKAAMAQMKGKTFAYPPEANIKPFISLVLTKADLNDKDFESLILDDPLTINAMRKGQADFQVGGAPSRITLEKEGFKPILTSKNIAEAAAPSAESEELSVLLSDGWMCTKEYYTSNHDTILRLASVNFRIVKYMNEHQDEALAIHMPYLSQVTGQSFTSEDGKVIYETLDPFYTFEQQNDWFHNNSSIYYYKHFNGAMLNSFIKQGIYTKTPPKMDDVIYADDIYFELEELKKQSDILFDTLSGKEMNPTQQSKHDLARKHYDNYNFLDAQRMAQDLVTELNG